MEHMNVHTRKKSFYFFESHTHMGLGNGKKSFLFLDGTYECTYSEKKFLFFFESLIWGLPLLGTGKKFFKI